MSRSKSQVQYRNTCENLRRNKCISNGHFVFFMSVLLAALSEGCIDSHSLSKDPRTMLSEISDVRERILELEINHLEKNLSLLSMDICVKERLEKAWQSLEKAKKSLEFKDYLAALHYWSESDFYYEYCKSSKQDDLDLNMDQLENRIRQAIKEGSNIPHNSVYGIEWVSLGWNALILSTEHFDIAKIRLDSDKTQDFQKSFCNSISSMNYALISFRIARNRDPQGTMINKEFLLSSLEEKIIELESEYNQILQELQQIEGENAEYALKEAETWHSKINKSENLYDKIWYLLAAIYELESYSLFTDSRITTEMMAFNLELLLEKANKLTKDGESLDSDMIIPHIFLNRAMEFQRKAETEKEKERACLSRVIVLLEKTCNFSEYWIELLKREQEERIFYIEDSKIEFYIKSLTYSNQTLIIRIHSFQEDDLDWDLEFDEKSKECSVAVNGEEITPPLLCEKKMERIKVKLKEGINIIEEESLIKMDTYIRPRPLPLGVRNFLGKYAYPFDEYQLQASIQVPHAGETKVTVQIPQDYFLAAESGLYLNKLYDPKHPKLSDFDILDLSDNSYIFEGNLNVFGQTEVFVIFSSSGTDSKLVLLVVAALFFFLGFYQFDVIYFARSLRRRKGVLAIISFLAYYVVVLTMSPVSYLNLFHICPLCFAFVGLVVSRTHLKR